MKRVLVLLIAGVMLIFAITGNAQRSPVQVDPNSLVNSAADKPAAGQQAPTNINQQTAAALARQKFPGTILRISLVGEGEGRRWQIRMEDKGRLFTVFVNAANGALSGGA